MVKHKKNILKKKASQRKRQRQHWDQDVGIFPSNHYTNFSNSKSKVDLRKKEFLFKDLKELVGHVDT